VDRDAGKEIEREGYDKIEKLIATVFDQGEGRENITRRSTIP